MTDKDIIKAIEYCKSENSCIGCPYEFEGEFCEDKLKEDALDLINRQERKIEELETALFNLGATFEYDAELIMQEKSVIKAEARKEFAENLKKHERYATDVFDHTTMVVVRVEDIDNVLEKMEEYSEE